MQNSTEPQIENIQNKKHKGFVIKSRDIYKALLRLNPIARDIYNWLEMNATHKDYNYHGVPLKIGQIVTDFSIIQNALAWDGKFGNKNKYTRDQIDWALRILKKKKLIFKEKYKANKILITINNYEFFQNAENYSKDDFNKYIKNHIHDTIGLEKNYNISDSEKVVNLNKYTLFRHHDNIIHDTKKDTIHDTIHDTSYNSKNNKTLITKQKKEKINKKQKKLKNEEIKRQFEKIYQIFKNSKQKIKIPDKKTTEFRVCIQAIEKHGFEFLKQQIQDYLEYLKQETWRQKKGFCAFMRSFELCTEDWKSKITEINKNKKHYEKLPSDEEIRKQDKERWEKEKELELQERDEWIKERNRRQSLTPEEREKEKKADLELWNKTLKKLNFNLTSYKDNTERKRMREKQKKENEKLFKLLREENKT